MCFIQAQKRPGAKKNKKETDKKITFRLLSGEAEGYIKTLLFSFFELLSISMAT